MKYKIGCIFCPYKKEDNCEEHKKCYSLSNLYYGKILELFPLKQLYNLKIKIEFKIKNRRCEKLDKKYGDYTLENDNMKFIWGMKSYYDLSKSEANMYTMNDIDIILDKKNKKYLLGVETAYCFDNKESEKKYLNECLNAFTKFMKDNSIDMNKEYELFMSNPVTSCSADSIEELYINFKIFVNGYCSL